MNRLKENSHYMSILSLINAVTLMLFLSCLNANSVLAQATERRQLNDTEQEIEQQIKAGKWADAKGKEISAEFLADLLKNYSSRDGKPSESVYIQNAVISHKLELNHVTITYWVTLENCIFNDDVDFSDSVFQKSLSLRGSTFKGAANFYQMSVEGDFRVNKATFESKEKQINFESINVGGTLFFYEAVLEGSFTLSSSVMKELECTGTKFKNNEAKFIDNEGKPQLVEAHANFYNITVNGNANFTRALFEGSANFESIDIEKNLELTEAQFNNPSKTIQFFGMQVGRNAHFNSTKFAGGLDMGRATVGGVMEFYQTQATNTDLAKTFSQMKVDTVSFEQAAIVPPYSLQGADYRSINPTSEGYHEILNLIEKSEYSPSVYTNLEAYYRREGFEKAADEVYVAGKKKERKVASVPGYLWNWVLCITVEYGKRLELALVWSIVFIVIGAVLFFRKDNMMLQKPEDKAHYDKLKYHPLWYSIALFLPIVELEDVKIWTPRPKQKVWRIGVRHYMRLHVILGFLLIPIGLAAWTGIIK